ncbi:MAG: multifunctional CCA addition/repair protein [Gammaproteobacteria bacterium]|nr:multifunctional CCA addition/repair protein [Gammaproteobacteria bacterium]|tara:strand:- start:907 stop:2142 length:1236 start_codon:yes stop_codon:yes gene_type:complete
MDSYLVGGAVRDKLLQLPVKDKDWVVVGARIEDLVAKGYRQVGKGFPVFLHPETNQEYALARTEKKIGPGYTGFVFDTSEKITLEQDLFRRDLTINAMAESRTGEVIDPYGGQEDLKNKILRHVSSAFSEDPLRVLRVARFAARLNHLGFKVAQETMELMVSMVASGELDTLVAERVWHETEAALTSPSPQEFIRILRQCEALKIVLPELDALFGVRQPEKRHPENDIGIYMLMCLEQVAKKSNDSAVRYATMVHDVGKAFTDQSKSSSDSEHETLGLSLQRKIAKRLRVPNEHANLAALVCEHRSKLLRIESLGPSEILNMLESLDALRRPERLEKFLLACEADAKYQSNIEKGEYPQRDYLTAILKEFSKLNFESLLASDTQNSPAKLVRNARLTIISNKIAQLAATNA